MDKISIDEHKMVLLDMLDSIDKVCEENRIVYYLGYGTLLGAVRHKGYIPWDDDIDIWMFRDDYNKFRDNIGTYGLQLKIYDIDNTPNYYAHMAKVVNTKTYLVENAKGAIPIGVYIDIFVIDYLSDDLKKAEKLTRKLHFFRTMLDIKTISTNIKRSAWKNAILNLGDSILKPISRVWLLRKLDSISQKYKEETNSEYCGAVSAQIYYKREIMKTRWFGTGVRMTFEGKKYNCPIGYKAVLKRLYGEDYMQLPPKDKQISHHDYEAHWI